MRRAAKVDANHARIVKALRDAGCLVTDLSAVGGGVPDLLVATPVERRLMMLEIKDGEKRKSAQKLTPPQEAFHAKWHGLVHVVTSVNEAISVVLGKEVH